MLQVHAKTEQLVQKFLAHLNATVLLGFWELFVKVSDPGQGLISVHFWHFSNDYSEICSQNIQISLKGPLKRFQATHFETIFQPYENEKML